MLGKPAMVGIAASKPSDFDSVPAKAIHLAIARHDMVLAMKYSLVRLVWPNTEELISRPFMGLLKIRWLLQDRMRT